MTNDGPTPEDERSWLPEDDDPDVPSDDGLPELLPTEGSEADVIEQHVEVPDDDDDAPR